MKIDFYEEIEKLTEELVSINSVVNSGGESEIAKYIYDFYNSFDYFKENPDYLILQETKNDHIKRHNTIALIKGNGKSNRTIVMIGHIDTVGIEDFKSLKPYALKSKKLLELLKKEDLNKEIIDDLESGNYMVGRGALDMKSGVAIQMTIGKYFLENLDELEGNLVIIAECDEEDSSHGIISALDILNKWKAEEDLEYELAINSDFTTSLYDGDDQRYIYLGTVGKLLPAIYISGIEAHVGQVFSGYDPNLLAGIINSKIDLNSEFCDESNGEVTLPPVSLQMRDLKDKYDVQTALAANMYYNFALHGMNPKILLSRLKNTVKEAFDESIKHLNNQYKEFCNISNIQFKKLDWELNLYTWEEYLDKLISEYGDEYKKYMKDYIEELKKDNSLNLPEFSLRIIDESFKKFDKSKNPTVILYYGTTFYQNMEMTGIDEREKRLLETTSEVIEYGNREFNEKLKQKFFYPYIADSSFLYAPEDKSGVEAFKENFPAWGHKYVHPIEKIEEISMPVINMGVYGKDGHKFTERLDKNYSFRVLPNLILEFIWRTFSTD